MADNVIEFIRRSMKNWNVDFIRDLYDPAHRYIKEISNWVHSEEWRKVDHLLFMHGQS